MQAAGAVIALVDHVVAASRQREAAAGSGGGGSGGGMPAGFAICRPPGHHCLPSGAMGFCILGNVSIAARFAQKQHGLQRVRVAGLTVAGIEDPQCGRQLGPPGCLVVQCQMRAAGRRCQPCNCCAAGAGLLPIKVMHDIAPPLLAGHARRPFCRCLSLTGMCTMAMAPRMCLKRTQTFSSSQPTKPVRALLDHSRCCASATAAVGKGPSWHSRRACWSPSAHL